MHEFTIATNIVAIVEEELNNRSALDSRVEEVVFVAGRLNAVIPAFLEENFNHLKKEKPFSLNPRMKWQDTFHNS